MGVEKENQAVAHPARTPDAERFIERFNRTAREDAGQTTKLYIMTPLTKGGLQTHMLKIERFSTPKSCVLYRAKDHEH